MGRYNDLDLSDRDSFIAWLEVNIDNPETQSAGWGRDKKTQPVKWGFEKRQWGHVYSGDVNISYRLKPSTIAGEGSSKDDIVIPVEFGEMLVKVWTHRVRYSSPEFVGFVVPKTILKRLQAAKGDKTYLEDEIIAIRGARLEAEGHAREADLELRRKHIFEAACKLVQTVLEDDFRHRENKTESHHQRDRQISSGPAIRYSDLSVMVEKAIEYAALSDSNCKRCFGIGKPCGYCDRGQDES